MRPSKALFGLYNDRTDDEFIVPRESIVKACAALRRNGYEHLSLITAIDWQDRWELVYHIMKFGRSEPVVLRVMLPYDRPELPSISGVWPGAVWHERETYDLMGIRFTGNPDLRRILLPKDYDEHPLRKEVLFGNRS